MHDHHHVQLRTSYMQTKHELDPHLEHSDDEYMVVFRDSDIMQAPNLELRRSLGDRTCSSDRLAFNSNPNHALRSIPVMKRSQGFWGSMPIASMLGKRQIDTNGIPSGGNSGGVNLSTTIGITQGCPSTRKVALVGIATDCSYIGSFNSTETAQANVIAQISSASQLYEKTFNITLGLQNITVNPAECPGTPPASAPWNIACGGNSSITDRLNSFSEWRGQRQDQNAYWSLLTNCPTGAEVGLAWLGQACVTDVTSGNGETVSGANIVARTSTEWQVFAHESGHTFGAVHDCDSQTCADGNTVKSQQCCPLSQTTCDADQQYIMNPSTGPGITAFSPCTVGNICSAFLRNSVKSSCLSDNRGVVTYTGHQCGNGIVEDDEDCDCGGTASCGNNQCCDPTTCKFKAPAVCDDSNEDCCTGCQFATSGTVCRSSTGSCNPQETCSGTNATCPPDQMAPDGQNCGNSTSPLQCASGQCTSRDLQCKTLMGSYTTNNDTYACNSQDCTLSCASPSFGPGECYSMQQNFLDGTVCGGGGKCANVRPSHSMHDVLSTDINRFFFQGQCKGSSTAKEVGSWISDNKNLVIGIAASIGGIILLSIIACIYRRCRRPRRSKFSPSRPPPMQQYGGRGPGGSRAQSGWYGQGGDPPWLPSGQMGYGHGGGPTGPTGPLSHLPPPVPPHFGGYTQPTVRYA